MKFLSLFLVLALPVCAQRGITAEDYFAFRSLSDPHLSPDGKLAAFVIATVDQKANRRHSEVWMASTDQSRAPWQFTSGAPSSSSPRWSPDGKNLAVLSPRGGAAGETARAQVYLLSMSGGEARAVTSLKNGVTSFRWSPDGTRLLCLSRTGPSDNETGRERSDVRHYTHILYKFNDTGWFDDRRSHIWVVDVATGASRQLTSGDDWDDTDPQWSPDGKRIAFVSNRTGLDREDNRNTDVWVISSEGGPLTKISDHTEPDSSPRWSPDGSKIAFIGGAEEGEYPKIWLAPSVGGGASTPAIKDLDLLPTDLEWSENGRALYFVSGVRGTTHLFRANLGEAAVQVTKGERAVHNPDRMEKAGIMVYAANDFTQLDDLYVSDAGGGNERRLTRVNEELWKQVRPATVERVPFKGADNWDVDGFFVKPLGWQEGKKYPMILSVHGGPAGQYGVDWYHEFQVYASRGWAVFFANPRGSTGYGRKFQRGVEMQWGGKAYQDIMNGVDAVLQKYPWIDRDRLGVTGGSYGGFMTNWIVSHTNRFKAAVTLRSISNFVSDDGTRDGPYGHKRDFGGDLFQNYDFYWDSSPLKYVKNVKTPTLILHSEMDFRVPIEQGEQWFRALKHYGVPTEMVIFPRENHNLTRTGEPKHLVESLNWQLYWFDRYLK